MDDNDAIELATGLTVAWLANPNTRVAVDDVPQFLMTMHEALRSLTAPPAHEDQPAKHAPAVSVRKSLASPDRIISMIDGKPYSSLKRHLKAHGLTPYEYRQRYSLKSDYPMIAPGYSAKRSAVAKAIGLGRRASEKMEAATPVKKAARGIAAAKRAAKAHLGGDTATSDT